MISVLTITSCTIYKEYPIEVYKPGAVAVSPESQGVTLVYRNFKYPADTLQHYYKKDYKLIRAKNDPENLDSLLVMQCLKGLEETLRANRVFNNIKTIPYDVFKRHSDEKLRPLDSELVKKLTGPAKSDLLVSLETFSCFYSSYPETSEAMGGDEVITVAAWGVYHPDEEKIVERKSMIDTLFWEGYDQQENYDADYNPPPRLDALKIAASMAGENYAKRFYASWQTVYRNYSVPPLPDFSDAALYFEEGKWDTAIELWKKYADDSNGKMAINARYNIALAYELKDQMDLAIRWLTEARDLAEKTRSRKELVRIIQYQKILAQRQKEINQLNRN